MKGNIRIESDSKMKEYWVLNSQYFTLRWPKIASDKFKEKIQKLVDARKDWASQLYTEIAKRMRFVIAKGTMVTLDDLDYEEVLLAFADAWKKQVKLNETPKQQTIGEATAAGNSAKKAPVKPLKKK